MVGVLVRSILTCRAQLTTYTVASCTLQRVIAQGWGPATSQIISLAENRSSDRDIWEHYEKVAIRSTQLLYELVALCFDEVQLTKFHSPC
jgi:hypothetical protein